MKIKKYIVRIRNEKAAQAAIQAAIRFPGGLVVQWIVHHYRRWKWRFESFRDIFKIVYGEVTK